MPTLYESRLQFDFDDNWKVEQWDELAAYRAPGGFGRLSGTAACDFMGLHAATGAYLFEVKNHTDHHHANSYKFESADWHQRLAGKVRDTLAGAIWTRGRDGDQAPVSELIAGTLDAVIQAKPSLTVVFWIDDRPALDTGAASVLAGRIQTRLMRWFKIRKVIVTSSDLFQAGHVPGLTVRPAP